MWGLLKRYANTTAQDLNVKTQREDRERREAIYRKSDRVQKFRIAKVGNDWIVCLPLLDARWPHYELHTDFSSASAQVRMLLATS